MVASIRVRQHSDDGSGKICSERVCKSEAMLVERLGEGDRVPGMGAARANRHSWASLEASVALGRWLHATGQELPASLFIVFKSPSLSLVQAPRDLSQSTVRCE
jgi:hypothetical protein